MRRMLSAEWKREVVMLVLMGGLLFSLTNLGIDFMLMKRRQKSRPRMPVQVQISGRLLHAHTSMV